MGAALTLGAAILLAGGAPHWALAALVPPCAGLALAGVAEAALPLAYATMLVGCLAVVASDRGRFVPVDLAVLAPLLVWFLAPRILPRLNRAGPVLAQDWRRWVGGGANPGGHQAAGDAVASMSCDNITGDVVGCLL